MVAPHRPHNARIKPSSGDKRFWAEPVKPWPPRSRSAHATSVHRSHRVSRGSWLGSVGIHLVAGLLLLGLPRPAIAPEVPAPPKPVQVIEVEFVEIPTANPNKTAAAPPPTQQAQTKAPDAPVKPVTKPKPVARAPRPQTAPRVAPRPQPRPARRPPDLPIQRIPSQQELAQLAAARLKGRDSDVSDRLATLREGVNQSEDDASARMPQRGTPSVSKALPQGELSGRGVLRAPTPEYPAEAQRKIWEGTTQIMVYVNPDGSVREATVVGSSGFPSLDAAAKRAAAAYQFSPLPEGDNHLERGVIPFSFVIR